MRTVQWIVRDSAGNVVETIPTPMGDQEANRYEVAQRARLALAVNAAFANAQKPATAAAQAAAAYDAAVRMARQQNGLIRLLLGLVADVGDT